MKIIKNLKFAGLTGLAVLAVTLLFQIPTTRAGTSGKKGDDDSHKLRLRVYFTSYHSTQADPNVFAVGDQLTFGGTLARFARPDQQIGSFGVQIVETRLEVGVDETLLHGVLNLPDGQISVQGFVPTARTPAPITGGTGAYLGAKGQLEHLSLANGVEEFILTFVGN